MRQPLLPTLLLAALALLTGCAETAYEGPAAEAYLENIATAAVEPAGDDVALTLPRVDGEGFETVVRPRMLRVTTSLVLRVDDFDAVLDVARRLVEGRDGYLTRLSYLRPTDTPAAGWLLYRLRPAEREGILRRLAGLGEVLREERQTEDVSYDFHLAHNSLLDLRAQRAALERQLEEATAREAVELRGRLLVIDYEEATLLRRYPELDGHEGTTPLHLTLTAEAGLIADPATRLTGAGLRQGYMILLHILRVLIIVLVVGVPVGGLTLLTIWLLRRLRRKRRPAST